MLRPDSEQVVIDYRDEYADLTKQYLDDARIRVNPAFKETRKRRTIDSVKTMHNARRYLGRFSAVCSCYCNHAGLYVRSMVVVNHKFVMLSCFMPFSDGYRQPVFTFDVQVTKIRVSQHALIAWLERNESANCHEGLTVIGAALVDEDQRLGELAIYNKKVASGSHERQIKCSDGGVAIVIIANPDEELYTRMVWTVVTYVDETRVRYWNEEKAASAYENTVDRIEKVEPIYDLLATGAAVKLIK